MTNYHHFDISVNSIVFKIHCKSQLDRKLAHIEGTNASIKYTRYHPYKKNEKIQNFKPALIHAITLTTLNCVAVVVCCCCCGCCWVV